jgi:hypothetical protein
MKFTKIPEDTFKKLQLNAGILLKSFDPLEETYAKEEILGATSGGVSFSAVPEFEDFGADIDNAPRNTKELKRIVDWAIDMSGTFITVDSLVAKSLIAAADSIEDTGDYAKITPRKNLIDEDFTDLWWVGDYSDENDEEEGGFVAIHMMNALSTGGFSISSGDRAKGTFAFTYSAHYSVADQDTVPFEVYIKPAAA